MKWNYCIYEHEWDGVMPHVFLEERYLGSDIQVSCSKVNVEHCLGRLSSLKYEISSEYFFFIYTGKEFWLWKRTHRSTFQILDFHRSVVEAWDIVWHSFIFGNQCSRMTYQSHLQGSSSLRRMIAWPLGTGPICCPETSVSNYQPVSPTLENSKGLKYISVTSRVVFVSLKFLVHRWCKFSSLVFLFTVLTVFCKYERNRWKN
jgi:hypothetical protein